MKYLTEYIEEEQGKLMKDTGTFYAFSNEQFLEQYTKDVKYVNMGMGMYTPKDNVEKVINGLDSILQRGIKQDIEDNGIDAIIYRELKNHEAFYTWDIESTKEALSCYKSITEKDILKVFYKKRK